MTYWDQYQVLYAKLIMPSGFHILQEQEVGLSHWVSEADTGNEVGGKLADLSIPIPIQTSFLSSADSFRQLVLVLYIGLYTLAFQL